MNIWHVLTCLMSPTCVSPSFWCVQIWRGCSVKSSKDCSLEIVVEPFPTSFLPIERKTLWSSKWDCFPGPVRFCQRVVDYDIAMMILQRSLRRVYCIATVLVCSMSWVLSKMFTVLLACQLESHQAALLPQFFITWRPGDECLHGQTCSLARSDLPWPASYLSCKMLRSRPPQNCLFRCEGHSVWQAQDFQTFDSIQLQNRFLAMTHVQIS